MQQEWTRPPEEPSVILLSPSLLHSFNSSLTFEVARADTATGNLSSLNANDIASVGESGDGEIDENFWANAAREREGGDDGGNMDDGDQSQ